MRLDSVIDEVISLIKSNSFFDDKRVMYSFPSYEKPTRLRHTYICLGLGELELEASSLDASKRAGELVLNIDIFAPLNSDSRHLLVVLSRLCECLNAYNVLSISASEISIDNEAQAYTLKSKITLGGELDFGGGDNE